MLIKFVKQEKKVEPTADSGVDIKEQLEAIKEKLSSKDSD